MPIISLQVTDDLLERFEDVRKKAGFPSKSEALRESIVNFIESRGEMEKLGGYKIMTINLVYPFKDVIVDEITEIYSRYHGLIKTVSDWRIAEKKIELVLTVGEYGLIRDLYKEITKIKEMLCSIHEIIIE